MKNAKTDVARLATLKLSAALAKRWRNVRPYAIPEWCPPELAPLHATILMKLKGRTKQARQLIEEHMRMHRIAAPSAAIAMTSASVDGDHS